ncbi:hypothetical protein [Winogradskyella wandonensis]|nr:hypothetical protein [Winogradskyella wandonensis]
MRSNFCFLFLLSVVDLFFSTILFSQNSKINSHNSYAEKIYLQLDSEIYTTDKTIWFKAIIANASLHNLEMTSGVLYVDLINSDKEIIESKLIKTTDGIGSGHFDLDRSYEEGAYQIRAYTQWNKNFEDDFQTKKYIQIFSENELNSKQKVISNIRRIDSTSLDNHYKLDIYPQIIDSTHKKSLKVFIDVDNERDTLYINPASNDKYILDLKVSKSSKLASIKILTRSGKTFQTQFTTNTDYINLRFFPEGGKLVSGLTSKIGFKAVNSNGKGIYVEGSVENQKGEVITNFKSNLLGMGHFTLANLDEHEVYTARLKTGETFALPNISKFGYVLKVSEIRNVITVGVFSNYMKDEEINLMASLRGVTYFNSSSRLINGSYIFSIPKSTFPEGIISFKVFGKNKVPISERLYFNELKASRLIIDGFLDKQVYEKRDMISLNILNKSQNDSLIEASSSILVLEKSRLKDLLYKENILSFFLLNSDLRGNIESPNLYFSEEGNLNVDDLMLTQGWRNYKYVKLKGKLINKLEKGLNVSGIVNVRNKKFKDKEIDVMLVTFNDEKTIYTKSVIPPTSFTFQLEDMFGKPVDIAIQSANGKNKKRKDYFFSINKKEKLPIEFDFSRNEITNDSIIIQNREQKKVTDRYFERTFGVTKLDEVVIDGYRMTPKRKEVFELYGKPEIVIDGKTIQEKKASYSYGLFSVLLDFFPDKVNVVTTDDGILVPQVIGEVTCIMVDGIPVRPIYYPILQNISVEEVESYEVLETAKNYTNLYLRVYPNASPPFPSFGGIISIYTKRGTGLFGAINDSKGLDINTIPVFAIEREFYTPAHDNSDPNSFNIPDFRSTIYWNPKVTNEKGKPLNISYSHSDEIGDFIVIIESITKDGKIGYKTLEYTVKEGKD